MHVLVVGHVLFYCAAHMADYPLIGEKEKDKTYSTKF